MHILNIIGYIVAYSPLIALTIATENMRKELEWREELWREKEGMEGMWREKEGIKGLWKEQGMEGMWRWKVE